MYFRKGEIMYALPYVRKNMFLLLFAIFHVAPVSFFRWKKMLNLEIIGPYFCLQSITYSGKRMKLTPDG